MTLIMDIMNGDGNPQIGVEPFSPSSVVSSDVSSNASSAPVTVKMTPLTSMQELGESYQTLFSNSGASGEFGPYFADLALYNRMKEGKGIPISVAKNLTPLEAQGHFGDYSTEGLEVGGTYGGLVVGNNQMTPIKYGPDGLPLKSTTPSKYLALYEPTPPSRPYEVNGVEYPSWGTGPINYPPAFYANAQLIADYNLRTNNGGITDYREFDGSSELPTRRTITKGTKVGPVYVYPKEVNFGDHKRKKIGRIKKNHRVGKNIVGGGVLW